MEKTIKIINIESLRAYIRLRLKGGISELAVCTNITLPKIRDVLEGRTQNLDTIKKICDFLAIPKKDIKEWSQL